jgi:hypothetical protein
MSDLDQLIAAADLILRQGISSAEFPRWRESVRLLLESRLGKDHHLVLAFAALKFEQAIEVTTALKGKLPQVKHGKRILSVPIDSAERRYFNARMNEAISILRSARDASREA